MKKLKHIKTFSDDFPVQRRMHRHVHLDVVVGKASGGLLTSSPLYWRLDHPKFNLVEIGIDRNTGRLVSITMPLYNGGLYPLKAMEQTEPGRNAVGIPGFALDLWATAFFPGRNRYDIRTEFYDVPGRCRLEVGEKELRIVLFPDAISYYVTSPSNLVCEFNESGELCAILVTGLHSSEKATLELNQKRLSLIQGPLNGTRG